VNRFRFPDLMSYGFIPGTAMACLSGFAIAALGFFIPAFLGGRGPELGVLSMMLTAAPAAFVFPMKAEIPDHRSWLKQWALYFSYFLGIMGFVAIWCLARTSEAVWGAFGFITHLPEVKMITLGQGVFPQALNLIPHNLGVALATAFLTVVYGVAGGSVLLTWNACVWSITLTMLVLRSAETTGHGAAILAVLPHTLIELSAYSLIVVCAAALRRSTQASPTRWGMIATMLATAIVLIGIAAVTESSWPRFILEW
jgi:hypothetical protein